VLVASGSSVVVTLDGAVLDGQAPSVHADDPMLLRGDGVFETLLVRGGRPCLLGTHLARLATSAAVTGLTAPEPARWRHAVTVAVARWTADWDDGNDDDGNDDDGNDAVLRLVLGRGRGTMPTAFVAVSAVPVTAVAARRHGVAAVTLDRGGAAPGGARAPWSLATAKSLSYAPNTAALRHAERFGAQDVVFVDAHGSVLEGPRSTVVVVDGDGALLTPPTALPILPGTTMRALFEQAREHGLAYREEPIGIADLHAAQGVWLLSSVTLAARVHTLDGTPLRPTPPAADVGPLVDAAILRAD
jgi:4-amino-4-deoxychorismate lyase